MNTSERVYIPEAVEAVLELYGILLINRYEFNSIKHHLEVLSDRLFEAWLEKEPGIVWEISNYHPEYISCSTEKLFQADFKKGDARLTIAREYGYRDWDDLRERGDIPYESHFEEAVDLLIDGKKAELLNLLDQYPDLVHQKSNYGHQAGLLHYCTSNGVELWRQRVPINLAEIIQLLLRRGANIEMKMNIYGGRYNPLALLRSSAHPLEAGVAREAISCFEGS